MIPLTFIGGAAGNQSLNVAASSTANALGAWVLFGSVPYVVNKILWTVDNTSSNVDFLSNIGIGASGSQITIIQNIPSLGPADPLATFPQFTYVFETSHIPPNTDIWLNCQSATASYTPRISLAVGNSDSSKGGSIVAVGSVTSSSSGTPFSYGANANGAWVNLGSIPVKMSKFQMMVDRDPNSLNTVNIGWSTSGASAPSNTIFVNVPILANGNILPLEAEVPPGDIWIQGQGSEVYTGSAAIMMSS